MLSAPAEASIPDLTQHRWHQFYDEGVPPHLTYPQFPIYQLLSDSARRNPTRTCAIFYGKHFTYRQIDDLSDRFAAGLVRLGVKPGDKLALLLPNSPQFLIAYYGALKAGAVLVPLNPLYTERELTHHLADSEAQTVVTIPTFAAKVVGSCSQTSVKHIILSRIADFLPFPLNWFQRYSEAKLLHNVPTENVIEFKTLQTPAPGFAPVRVDPNTLAILIYSGGTTGTAKGVMLSHFQVVASAIQVEAWGHLVQPRVLASLPLFHGFGMSLTMNAPVLSGGEIVLIPRFEVRGVLEAIQKYKPSFFIGVPTMFAAFNNLPDIESYDLTSLEGIFVGAAPLTHALKATFEARTGGRMVEGYGLTEVVTACVSNPLRGRHKSGSVGVPMPDMDCRIVSLEDGHDLPPGERGEILLHGPTLMLGYYKNPEETARTIVAGWLSTGDVGYMDEDGYLYLTDRKKELIIVGGFNVFPRDIDEVIYQHPKVKEGIAVGIPDPYKGERIKAYLVLKDGLTATPEEFSAFFRAQLAPYKVPTEIEFRTELPKSMIGKILRRVLREEELAKIKPQ